MDNYLNYVILESNQGKCIIYLNQTERVIGIIHIKKF